MSSGDKSLIWIDEKIDFKMPKVKGIKKFKTNRKVYLATYEGVVKKTYEEFKNK